MLNSTEIFRRLHQQSLLINQDENQGLTEESGVANSGGTLRLFQDQSGSRGIFVPFGQEDPDQLKAGVVGQNLTLREFQTLGQRFAELKLTEPRLQAVLEIFLDEYLRLASSDSERSVTILRRELDKWRSFFTVARTKKLSISAEIGLIGELQTLRYLLDEFGTDAFYWWAGPDSSRHDFHLPNYDIECKSTLIRSGLHVTVHGAGQLSLIDERPLRLWVRKYEASPQGNLALSDIVSKLLSDDRIPSEVFVEKLHSLNFSMAAVERDNENRYTQTEQSIFNIGEDFPRITASQLHDRVAALEYVLDLTPPSEIPGYLGDDPRLIEPGPQS